MNTMRFPLKTTKQIAKPPMGARHRAIHSMPVCIMISLLGHFVCFYAITAFNPFELRAPVRQQSAIRLTLEDASAVDMPGNTQRQSDATSDYRQKPVLPENDVGQGDFRHSIGRIDRQGTTAAVTGTEAEAAEVTYGAEDAQSSATREELAAQNRVEHAASNSVGDRSAPSVPVTGLQERGVRQAGEFMTESREKLVYRISLGNIPAGTAVIEATTTGGDLRITARVTSNDFLSAVYPVDDFIDTRLIKGNYLVTRIRQREGGSMSDTGFTLMLREHTAFWVDRLRERYLDTPLPREDITDLLSGLYFLRNLPLEVGTSVVLHLFDGGRYAPAAVEVVKKERLNLPGFREAETVVVNPKLSAAGFFTRTGPLSIWFTVDEKRVPVRMETSIPWGRVRAELVSAESGPSRP
ncbi:MAG: DUF3108 domain-containing protein [Deltaproteobacteria bacterium]|nr:DUF3108 domain-containing protein [Deltaproteobacteria bacterium]